MFENKSMPIFQQTLQKMYEEETLLKPFNKVNIKLKLKTKTLGCRCKTFKKILANDLAILTKKYIPWPLLSQKWKVVLTSQLIKVIHVNRPKIEKHEITSIDTEVLYKIQHT